MRPSTRRSPSSVRSATARYGLPLPLSSPHTAPVFTARGSVRPAVSMPAALTSKSTPATPQFLQPMDQTGAPVLILFVGHHGTIEKCQGARQYRLRARARSLPGSGTFRWLFSERPQAARAPLAREAAPLAVLLRHSGASPQSDPGAFPLTLR